MVFPGEDRQRILELIDGALASGQLTLGPLTEQLEGAFAARHGGPLAVATSSGTQCPGDRPAGASAWPGREVVVPANTFFATAAAVLHAGGRPRFADVDADHPVPVRARRWRPRSPLQVAAAVHVHIGGRDQPGRGRQCAGCARARGLTLIEDAAHAHGSSLDGQPAGSWSARRRLLLLSRPRWSPAPRAA